MHSHILDETGLHSAADVEEMKKVRPYNFSCFVFVLFLFLSFSQASNRIFVRHHCGWAYTCYA